MSGGESNRPELGHTPFGPRFWLADSQAGPKSARWHGLSLAWKTSGHLRALLALSIILLVLCRLAPFHGAAGPAERWIVLFALICGLVFVSTATFLTTMLLLGVLQFLTGRSPDELRLWYLHLPVWVRFPVLLMFGLFLMLGTLAVVLGLLYLTPRLAGLV